MRITTGAALVAVLAALSVGSANAATPVTVSIPVCYFAHGGNVTVPAGSDVTMSFGWASSTKGRVLNFESAQTTTASRNGSPVPNASSLWGAPEPISGGWVAFFRLSAGTLANPGDSMVVTMQISLSRKTPQGKDPDTGKQLFSGPGDVLPSGFGCTVTAV